MLVGAVDIEGAIMIRPGDRRIVSVLVVAAALFGVSFFLRPLVLRVGEAAVEPQAGLERLRARMGGFTPTGAGVTVLQVEAAGTQGWTLGGTSDRYRGVLVQPVGPTSEPSPHASMVANAMLRLAPGIERIYTASSSWLMTEVLRAGTGEPPRPLPPGTSVAFCAWVGSAGGADDDVLRRADFLVQRAPFVLVGGYTGQPLMGAMYNGIAVGEAKDRPNRGTSDKVDGPGRCKPDLVTSHGAASPATGEVAGAAAMLIEAAGRLPRLKRHPEAARPEMVKAVLLAGAVREADWTNLPDAGDSAGGTTATTESTGSTERTEASPDAANAEGRVSRHPLDRSVGAGRLDVARAVGILAAGTPEAEATGGDSGWRAIEWSNSEGEATREVVVPIRLERAVGELAIVACWNRVVDNPVEWRLSNVDLAVERADDLAEIWSRSGNVASRSVVDNVEMILLRQVAAGAYRIRVTLAEGEAVPVSLAWLASGPYAAPRRPAGSDGG